MSDRTAVWKLLPLERSYDMRAWAIIDGNRMRMFSKHECRDAMSFPREYIVPQQHQLAVHMLGNSVAPKQVCDVINAIREAA
ncbi:DNA cytosine methyltransferase [Cupriavidus plantarum]|uniref:DNA cytosine methyltransferase n=1 Tax=Cupriavidus plantarum TaxID=942865 RepID=UPI00339D40BF